MKNKQMSNYENTPVKKRNYSNNEIKDKTRQMDKRWIDNAGKIGNWLEKKKIKMIGITELMMI